MAQLQQTSITGSLNVSGSTIIMPNLTASVDSGSTGQIWIDDSPGLFMKFTTPGTSIGTIQSPASFMGAWSVGGNLSVGRQSLGGTGTNQNDSIVFGGCQGSSVKSTCTEEYNGTSWSSGGALGTAIYVNNGAGTQNAALQFKGRTNTGDVSNVCSYNGSSWSSAGNLIYGGHGVQSTGTQNAALEWGGPGANAKSELWNGSSTAAGPDLPTGFGYGAGFGSPYSAVGVESLLTQIYDGVSWFYGNAQTSGNSTRISPESGGTSEYSGWIAGGSTPTAINAMTEYNGLTWANSCTMPTSTTAGKAGLGGSTISGLTVGGSCFLNTTQEYTKNDIVPYTTSVWSSGAGNILAKAQAKGAGDANAALSFAGIITNPTRVTCTEEYDGTNWTAGGAMINARNNHGGTGTANAALAAGGEPTQTCTEEYNGTSWASGGTLSQGGYGNATLGTQNDAINFGGNFTGKKAESYDGSSWSTISDMNCCRRASGGGAGTTNAAIVFGGRCYTAPTTCQLTLSEEWNGSSWSFGGSYTTCVSDGVAGGETVNTALATGGYNPANPTGTFQTELYDGTSWSAGGNALDLIKQSAGHSIGDSAFATGGNPQNNKSQFYNAVCSTTMCSALGAWSGAASMINSRYSQGYSPSGTQNAALASGGYTGASVLTATEEYDGTSWSAGGALTEGKWLGGSAGTQNANLFVAGANPTNFQTNAQEYDGSSWSNITAFPTGKNALSGTGTEPAALFMGGQNPSVQSGTTEWNGSAWSAGGSLITARRYGGAAGTQNAGLYAVGDTLPSKVTCTEEYDGSSWSTGGVAITAVNQTTIGGCQYNAFIIGGVPGAGGTQLYNGAAWEMGFPLPQNTNLGGVSGTQTNTIFYGGFNPSATNKSYEFTCTTTGNCVGVWSVGGAVITQRDDMHFGAVGSQNATALFSGRTAPTNTTSTEEYNGTSWSEGGATITSRYIGSSNGTVNAGLFTGGNNVGSCVACNEEYNGSSWSTGGAMACGADFLTGVGTQNASVAFGGRDPSCSNGGFCCNRHYNGSSWSAEGSLSVGKYASGGTGTQNATLAFGGYTAPSANGYQTPKSCAEEYDGSSWSTKNSLLLPTGAGNSAGTSNDALFMGGYTHPAAVNYNQLWDGTAWSTAIFLPQAGQRIATGGTSSTEAIVSSGLNKMGTFEFNCSNLLGAGLSIKRTEVTVS